MAVYRNPGKKTWIYDFVKAGIRFRKGGFKTEEGAKDAEAEARSKAKLINTEFGKLCEMRLSALQKKTTKSHYTDQRTLFDVLIKRWMFNTNVSKMDIQDFLDEMAETKSPKRANTFRAHIRGLFNWAVKYELISYNPAKGIDPYPIEASRKYVPPLEDLSKVLQLANEDQLNYLMFLAHTAARSKEINQLKWEDIHRDRGYLELQTRKSKFSNTVRRKIFINQTLARIIDRMKPEGEYVFFHPVTNKPYAYRRRFLKTLCKKAKVEIFTYHCLRHLSASIMALDNVPLPDIQKVLGHARMSTTDIYVKSLMGEITGATNSLDKIGGFPPKSPTEEGDDA
jgi:integrase